MWTFGVWTDYRPYVAVHGGRAHDAVRHGHDAVHRLGLHGEAVAGGAEAVPVEDVDGSLAGATYHLPPPFHHRNRGQVPALKLWKQLEAPPFEIEHAHGAVAAVQTDTRLTVDKN